MMFQAITTRFFGPSNFRGSRIKATTGAGSVTLSYNHSLNGDQNHAVAAETLARKFGWAGRYFQGEMPEGNYCFVRVDSNAQPAFVIEG